MVAAAAVAPLAVSGTAYSPLPASSYNSHESSIAVVQKQLDKVMGYVESGQKEGELSWLVATPLSYTQPISCGTR